MGFLGLATDWNRCRVWQSIHPFALSTDAFPSYALIQKNARTIPLVDIDLLNVGMNRKYFLWRTKSNKIPAQRPRGSRTRKPGKRR